MTTDEMITSFSDLGEDGKPLVNYLAFLDPATVVVVYMDGSEGSMHKREGQWRFPEHRDGTEGGSVMTGRDY